MIPRLSRIRLATVAMALLAALGLPLRASAGRVAIAANDSANLTGNVRVHRTRAPWAQVKAPLPVGADSVVKEHGRKLYALSRRAGTLAIIAKHDWEVRRTLALGTEHSPEDIAVVDPRLAYVSRTGATHLLRVDLRSGQAEEVVDLSAFADEDGIPDLGSMIVVGDRLLVAIQRKNEKAPLGLALPAYLAVIDVPSEQLLDVDAKAPGVQAIELAGSAPKHRMQVVGDSLFVSATGGFFDEGGIETIDLLSLTSQGLVIAEADGKTGADLGPFVMTTAEEGFLVFSTDFDLSSHLEAFSVSAGVVEEQLHVTVGYAVPAIGFDSAVGSIFVPEETFDAHGLRVFDAGSGEQLTKSPLPTEGRPTDVLVLRSAHEAR